MRKSEAAVIELTTMLADQPQSPDEEAWVGQAVCSQTDPDAFFPEKGGSTREAKRICQGCPAKDACLQWAIDHDERFGIWGGLSERERRRLKRGIGPDEAIPPAEGVDELDDETPIADTDHDRDHEARLAG
ncbi:WhiB family transcriptional regulator [Mycolicibacterium fortuitum subsp. acetamidolyticum]|uniref:Transcriptional regulator WhiB n=1 Tax=Mycolicibacterium fortuitum subsp. acetamidolyticum TaxID=144550 RepID=A0A100WQK0_MYCFO|nr:WhiB family transcriptional regulator [Mycolicibacterium fortuitum subsp. acetamidolyticum]